MKSYKFKINGKEYAVDINGIEGKNAEVTVNGVAYNVELEDSLPSVQGGSVPSASFGSAPAGSKDMGVNTAGVGTAAISSGNGQSAPAAPAAVSSGNGQSAPAAAPAAPAGAGVTVKSPLPGVIISIDVKEGQAVKKGQKVAVLEAMKMENEIQADADGTVAAILVSKGDSVLEGAEILRIA